MVLGKQITIPAVKRLEDRLAIPEKAKRWLNNTFWLTALPMIFLQIPQWYNHFNNRFNPSALRQDFESRYQVSISGWSDEIEKRGSRVTDLSEIISREQEEMPFSVTAVSIVGQSILKNDVVDTALEILSQGMGGSYFLPGIRTLSISTSGAATSSIRGGTFYAIKKLKIEELAERNPQFIEDWSGTYHWPVYGRP